MLIGAHPDTPGGLPADPTALPDLAPVMAELQLPFATVDFTRHEDGRWRVVELGDGQVSDRPSTIAPAELIESLDIRTPKAT